MKKVIFATPSLNGPIVPYIKSMKKSIPLITKAGWEEGYIQEIGCPYISAARATMTRKALTANADVIIYIDYDLSWRSEDLLKLLTTEGDVVAGTYRYKKDEEEYMGDMLPDDQNRPIVRSDGCIKAGHVPAGFLKVTVNALRKYAKAYPELLYGDILTPSLDLFNHGAHNGVWYGEDYAFSRRWTDCGGEIWLIPDMNLDHHNGDKIYKGNFHKYLLRQPGGAEHKLEEDTTMKKKKIAGKTTSEYAVNSKTHIKVGGKKKKK